MFKYERTDKIMELLSKHKYATVSFLVEKLHYSPATIRRDLTYLESTGLVKKSYGGVCINEYAKPMIVREHENTKEKIRIAHEASKLINDGDRIFIDSTSTTSFMGEFLLNKNNIYVVTSNLKLAAFLGENKVPTYCTGGMVVDTNSLSGTLATETINKFNFDICFVSVSGISDDGYISCNSEIFRSLINTAISKSKKTVCMCNSEKLGKSFLINITSLDKIDYVISDDVFDKNLVKKFKNTKFITAT